MASTVKSDKSKINVLEFLKCKKSFDYYCENYVLIPLPGGDTLLKPYAEQTRLIKSVINDAFICVLKSRQIGISTIIQAYISWLTVFYENVVVGVISKDATEATKFARFVMGIVDRLPKWMQPKFEKRTERTFILSNGSRCVASPVAPSTPEKTLRGEAVTFLVIDEAAFIKFIDVAWTAIVPALSTNQKQARDAGVPFGTVLLSTPNKSVGVGKWFFDKYQKASASDRDEELDSIFKCHTIHWRNIPELANDPDWYKTQCRLFDNDQKKIQQELELKFLGGEGTFFPEDIVIKLQDLTMEPIQKYKLFGGEVWIFENPVPEKMYLIGVDTAPEHGHDKSAITIWDHENLNQVWEYQSKCSVIDFTNVVKVAISQYPCIAVIESNSYGNQVVEEVNNSEYCVSLYKEKRGPNMILPGLQTTSKTRPLMIDALYSYVCQFPECVKSKRLALELVGLVEKTSGRVEADEGCYDDLALSAALAFYVRKYDPPMMINPTKFESSYMGSIIGMNSDVAEKLYDNSNVMKMIKEELLSNAQGNNNPQATQFIDVLSILRK